jgi:hypothetical protein|tara:strand:- start:1169 stop:2755 length:1587 start_codon:yes stop_codon:yes gene_type:complete
MDRNTIGRYFQTLRYLKAKQIYYRIFYFLRNKIYRKNYNKKYQFIANNFFWKNRIYSIKSYFGDNTFEFLNKRKKFDKIDWNFEENGKLWNYNLVYFDFLNQDKVHIKNSLEIINDFILQDKKHISGHEPYTISLRNINFIKFVSSNKIKESSIDKYIYNSYIRLIDSLEFHLLGNHLLENAFSLLFGSYYFNDKKFYKIAEDILIEELENQILDDGGHFELSPMYHCIILNRVLDSIAMLESNDKAFLSNKLYKKLKDVAVLMLSWLNTIIYRNNSIPHLNDSTYNIAFSPFDLFNYGKVLNLKWDKIILNESGYRKYSTKDIECIIDIGKIGPDYLPGHSHSDTFNFEINFKNLPYIVDTGISTYENNQLRLSQRSTFAHNTITVNDEDQSEVWNAFRVGRRAKIIDLNEEDNIINASHNGYQHLNATHNRKFILNSNSIIIQDKIINPNKYKIKSCLHFHPSRSVKYLNNTIFIDKKIELKLEDYLEIHIEDYNYCLGFNKTVVGKKLVGTVKDNSKIEIIFKNL